MRIYQLVDPRQLAIELRKSTEIIKRYDEAIKSIEKIVNDVRLHGDDALFRYTYEFDGVDLRDKGLRVTREDIEEAYNRVTNRFISSVEACIERIEEVERSLLMKVKDRVDFDDGSYIVQTVKPMERVGCYIPRGSKGYPSTVMMTCVPAIVAGVKKISIVSPPLEDGSISPYALVTADILGIKEIFRVGGPQGIAALAFGTETIPKVDKIVGPGNLYVSIAKAIVSRYVSIDFFAGPSEALIFIEDVKNIRRVLYDVISQMEHGPASVVGVVTTSKDVVDKLIDGLPKLLDLYPMIRGSLENMFIMVGDLDKCIEFINEFAPEHLRIYSNNYEKMMDLIENAGVILAGEYSPIPFSDYCMGANHVLPTLGWAKSVSGLSVLDFIKVVRIGVGSAESLDRYGRYALEIARAEEFNLHADTLEVFIDDREV